MPVFRYTTRELFLVVLSACIALGWWIDRLQMRQKVEESAAEQLNSRLLADDLARRLREIDPNWRDYVERPRVMLGKPQNRP